MTYPFCMDIIGGKCEYRATGPLGTITVKGDVADAKEIRDAAHYLAGWRSEP